MGKDVDHPANRVRSVERRTGSAQHLQLANGVHRNRQIQIVMPRLHVVDADAVDQHQRLTERASANRNVALYPVAALLQIDGGI